ncbi:hypothetical protein [Microbacterium sp. CPCC 204701]|uniref:hypothetical protein n=1 Tax=Microbacterium sp. CPCC 204701 TaxID=2493084 RepID=UPI000FDA462C|nr:hypothetical protein [Microbacterium sp. CPCC 204701]
MSEPEENRDFRPVDRVQVDCDDHEFAVLVARLDRRDGRWFLLPSSRELRHASVTADRPGDPTSNRFTLICRACRAEHRDQPLTIRGDRLSAVIDGIPYAQRLGMWNPGGDRLIVSRSMLRS